MTKILNRLIVKFAGRRHFGMAAQIQHAVRTNGRSYRATNPQFLSCEEAGPLLKAAFIPVQRVGMRVLGVRQFLRLQAVI